MPTTAHYDFKAVRAAMDFQSVLKHYNIEPQGQWPQVKIVCPFHDDHKPSCGVNSDKSAFKCFACHEEGNALKFVTLMEGYEPTPEGGLNDGAEAAIAIMGLDPEDFKFKRGTTAVRAKKKAGTPKPKKEVKAKDKPLSRVKKDEEPQGDVDGQVNPPLTFTLDLERDHAFFDERELSEQVVEQFGLGYCKKGIMAGRICIPLHNEVGELVAYAGRYVGDDEEQPRYKLPKGFQKSHLLYNLHRLIEDKPKHVVLVEGYWSVMRLAQEGIPCVASLGSALSDQQVELLHKAGVRYVTIMYDGDEGGQTGALDAAAKLSAHLYVRRITLPDGVKPDTMTDDYLDRVR